MNLTRALRRNNLRRSAMWRQFSSQTRAFTQAQAQPRFTDLPQVLESLNATLVTEKIEDPLEIIRWSVKHFAGEVAMSTSFGIQSAVLLHLATQVYPKIPIVWVDTGYLPAETYQYAEELKETLNLNLKVRTNREWSAARMEAVYGKLWENEDPKSHQMYGEMRKVVPLQEGLDSIEPNPLALLSGLRSAQTTIRSNMKTVGFQKGRFKILPMLSMSDSDVETYIDQNDLPRHPLQSKGYVTVGDWHSSRPLEEGENSRNTRFGGKFQECGLHADETEMDTSAFGKTNVTELDTTEVNAESGMAVILVKKIMEDGSLCRKCDDVSQKMRKDNVEQYIGATLFADMRETSSKGKTLAKHFEVATAPFFLVRSSNQDEWKPIKSYLQMRKMIEKSKLKIKQENQSQ